MKYPYFPGLKRKTLLTRSDCLTNYRIFLVTLQATVSHVSIYRISRGGLPYKCTQILGWLAEYNTSRF
jgi:hypothetical protein